MAGNKTSAIYQIINFRNGKRYVGSAVDVSKRFSKHRSSLIKGAHHSAKLQNAWNKYGEAEFSFQIIEAVSSPSDLLIREQYFIDLFKAVSSGYNISPTAGSPLGVRRSKETRARISATKIGKAIPADHRAKISAAKIGVKKTDETRQKISDARKGMKFSGETRERMSDAAKRRSPMSDDARKKLSAHRLGKRMSDEFREKMRASWVIRKQRKQDEDSKNA